MRILVTGSRNWTHFQHIADMLRHHTAGKPWYSITIVSGNCPTGADNMAEQYARSMAWNIELHPADWNTHGKKAGFLRNAEMVNLGADLCLAFILDASKGATHTANLAEKAGIKTIRILDNSTI